MLIALYHLDSSLIALYHPCRSTYHHSMDWHRTAAAHYRPVPMGVLDDPPPPMAGGPHFAGKCNLFPLNLSIECRKSVLLRPIFPGEHAPGPS